MENCRVNDCFGHRINLRPDDAPGLKLRIACGVHAPCSEPSRDGIKKLCISDKGTVKEGHKEMIACIRNIHKMSRGGETQQGRGNLGISALTFTKPSTSKTS